METFFECSWDDAFGGGHQIDDGGGIVGGVNDSWEPKCGSHAIWCFNDRIGARSPKRILLVGVG